MERINDSLKRLSELTKQIADAPGDANLRYEAGMIFLNNGQDGEGLRWLASALKENPSHRPTHQALADYYERTGHRVGRENDHRTRAAGAFEEVRAEVFRAMANALGDVVARQLHFADARRTLDAFAIHALRGL